MFHLTKEKIDRNDLINSISSVKAGALVTFEGWVRDHNEGKKVSSLEYQVYEELAQKEGQKILDEALQKFNLHHVVCYHRYGHLDLGDTAIFVGATATHRDDSFKASRYIIDEVKFRLPIWKKEHYLDHEARWVYCRDHHTHVHFSEEEFYERQSSLIKQETLKSSNVLVVGAGGLGCPVIQSLAGAGVGNITIVDFDKISISNIQRQFIYSPDVVGEYKSVVAASRMSQYNPFISVEGKTERVDEENIELLLKGRDLIIDCTDNLRTKFLLHDGCFKYGVPLISASVYKYEAQMRTYIPSKGFGCLRCSYDQEPSDSIIGNCNEYGVLGATVNAIGSLQASEAIQFLEHGDNSTSEATLFFNLKDFTQHKLKNLVKENCQTCLGNVDIEKNPIEVTKKDVDDLKTDLIDIRNIIDEDVITKAMKLERVTLYCNKGIRSLSLAKKVRELGHQNCYSLKGGAPL